MSDKPLYAYHCRPGYGSENLLIEFIRGTETSTFTTDVLDALQEILPTVAGLEDLWMNDEIIYSINSVFGSFTLSKDIWDFAFIMADMNQPCIVRIDAILLADKRFEKINVNFDDYKT
ncbi:hypothetical protein [Cytophaga hutchinsonii]|jgi:hypothetical protein|uniref:Uncharacterized protein n=1 Tax=Cytophaga hutchinsonii (strain ATCC 33406 / DSM 1761 / CIP 103989 / NBRC 15051 / NCIMB 9469 / D465) TaxID=269798 RepID=A0A6N4STL5_CYTH3|nr:hypothetical protein [Cytophaga hutchinsonii]ABG59708.1 hypothetical protein CHU_2453 [Cytophaga hutchinsonii ATCC 33406]SFX65596.1 hypothetical protein SAMN04487930_10779 [Cytophaga hutchinsonii ATCC 33406]